jgi:hypothetical protein
VSWVGVVLIALFVIGVRLPFHYPHMKRLAGALVAIGLFGTCLLLLWSGWSQR